jgi:hypothetical protein
MPETDPVAVVRDVFLAAGWVPDEVPAEDGVTFEVDIDDDIPLHGAVGHVDSENSRFVLLFEFESPAAPAQHDAVARALTLANFGLTAGRFELDYGTGLVRFAQGIEFAGAELTEPLVRNLITASVDILDVYAWAIDEVIRGEADPNEAISQAEQ